MYEYEAELINVVDGDTVDLLIHVGFHITIKDRFRIDGIDTPERGQPGYEAARDRVSELLSKAKRIIVETYKPRDKYGRYLCSIDVLDSKDMWSSVIEVLLDEKLAKQYSGGRKE